MGVTDRRTDGQNYDSQDHVSIAASRGKKVLGLQFLVITFGTAEKIFTPCAGKILCTYTVNLLMGVPKKVRENNYVNISLLKLIYQHNAKRFC